MAAGKNLSNAVQPKHGKASLAVWLYPPLIQKTFTRRTNSHPVIQGVQNSKQISSKQISPKQTSLLLRAFEAFTSTHFIHSFY
ncbi:hypothetical protein ALTERO38_51390 [Alteromonas sp. 38]|nr:hypothetical protein ALTER154_70574 [Alteromonas sp. 154]VXB71190.1 hypothetical protein ALTERO38_51390 [Alteromonas sp. 38]